MSDEEKRSEDQAIPWPQLGDVAFQEGAEWQYCAWVTSGDNEWGLYGSAYKSAADVLAERVFQRGQPSSLLVYPIVFLYRHSLELSLKWLIVSGQQLLDHPLELKHVHRLDVLWGICRKILEEIWPEGSKTDLDAVGECLKQFCIADPHSMSFRYPITKDGQPTPLSTQHINIRNLYEVMERVANFLDCAGTGIKWYLDHKWYPH